MVVHKPLSQKEVESLIKKAPGVKQEQDVFILTLRVPLPLLKLVDEAVSGRYGMNRTMWILEAMQEKLEKSKVLLDP